MSTSFLQVCLSPQGFCQGYWCLPEAPPVYPGVTLAGGWDKPPGLLSLCWQSMDLGGYYFPALASTESLPASLFTRGMSVSQQWEMRTFNSAPPMEEGLGRGRLWKPCRWPGRIASIAGFPCHIQRTLDWGSPSSCPGRRAMTVWPESQVHALLQGPWV